MMNFKKHLVKKKIFSLFLIAAITLWGCIEEKKEEDYAARVNDSFLSKKELKKLIDTTSSKSFYKSEVIRNWINRELLFQKAVEQGILEKEKYKDVIKNSERELAVALLLNQYVSGKKISFNPTELMSYFEENREDFKVSQNTYLLNIIHFSDEEHAVEFRSGFLSNGWDSTLVKFERDSTIIDIRNKVLLKEQDISPPTVLRLVKRLNPPEISIVISESNGQYLIVNVLEKYLDGSIPPFDVIKEEIEMRYLAKKRYQIIEDYIEKLYSTNDIEVVN
ncbi:MAG: peptidylprolyl isomerase [Ignavibacteriaceae bacterium]